MYDPDEPEQAPEPPASLDSPPVTLRLVRGQRRGRGRPPDRAQHGAQRHPREETARYLSENFQLADARGLLDEVYASVEG